MRRETAPRRLRIALLTHSVNPRGGVVHSLELAQALHAAGHDVTLMAPAEAGQTLFRTVPFRVQRVPVEAANSGVADMVRTRIAAYVLHLERVLAREFFDIFHAQDSISGNALAELVDAGRIDSFIRTVHHLDHFNDAQLATWQTRAWRSAAQVLCVSQTWCEQMRREHGVQAELVSNGVDTQRFVAQSDASDRALAERLGLANKTGPVFLAVGGIEERKNTQRILQAFIEVQESKPGARLLIAGGASLLDHSRYGSDFHALLRDSGLPTSAVQFTGVMADEDMPALFRLADVLMLPSLREGFGLVVLEALASGTPVVVSHIAPFTEYLSDALCHWADPLDAQSIASAMRTASAATRGPALRAEAQPLLDAFSWQASARRHLDLYEQSLVQRARLQPELN
ncbi:MSMEG_0565 family glycosyltransferase [Uliginosibacterium sediminicola]|uniref:MSMEG_0565 family glycosyltransferase n=1 Tax=Uliginosibacterium sediminicola TaxID=2024550 RepID=A0ABU9YVE2_9RHOO